MKKPIIETTMGYLSKFRNSSFKCSIVQLFKTGMDNIRIELQLLNEKLI